MQKNKNMLARSKEGREAALQRGKAGCDRRAGQGQLGQVLEVMLRTLPAFWALWSEGSTYGECLQGMYGDVGDQLEGWHFLRVRGWGGADGG